MAVVLTAAGLLSTPSASRPAPDRPGSSGSATSSYYVVPSSSGTAGTGDDTAGDDQSFQAGCTDGRAGLSGLRVLFFGTQESGGKIRPPGTSASSPVARVDQSWVQKAATSWIRGFTQCGSANAVLALGVNNKSDGGVDATEAGSSWARLVEQVGASAPLNRVAVTGAIDSEPSWSPPKWGRGWVSGYTSGTKRLLYAADSADGCPAAGPKTTCGNGWSVADVYFVATGAASSVVALPQIYRTDGAQAKQWGYISQWGTQNGGAPLRVVGVLSQQSACQQQAGCSGTGNSPEDARKQLSDALGSSVGSTNLVVTDMHWLGRPPT